MDNRRLLLAAFLSMALVIAWTILFPPKPPEKPPVAPVGGQTAAGPAAGVPAPALPPGAVSPAAPASPAQPVAAAREESVVLETNGVRATVSNRGAQLISMLIRETGRKESTLEMIRKRSQAPYPYGLTTGDGRPHPLNQALFVAARGTDGTSATFRYSGPEGTAEKRFALTPEGLLDVSVSLPGQRGWGVAVGPGIRSLSTEDLKSPYQQRSVVYKTDEVKTLYPQKVTAATPLPGLGLRFIGLQDTYFLAAVIPQKGLQSAMVQPYLVEGADTPAVRYTPLPGKDELTSAQKELPRELRMVLLPEGDALSLRSYWGNKSYAALKALPYGLEETINWGMLRPLSLPLLAAIHWLHDHVVANYGWAIVLMTVLIKLALLPLTHQSMKSMKKMQEINPKMQALRARYATKLKDKQGRPNLEMQRKMNDEMMALYKENGVNPAGGCLPILVQMPVFFAYYRLLSTAAELRGAPWMLWIRDLSVYDPYFVLQIVMGLTQFLQVKLSPQTGDPMQRRMFMVMPLVMIVFLWKQPSGLVLYWLTNNVLTILQQGVYNRLQKRAA